MTVVQQEAELYDRKACSLHPVFQIVPDLMTEDFPFQILILRLTKKFSKPLMNSACTRSVASVELKRDVADATNSFITRFPFPPSNINNFVTADKQSGQTK